MLRFELRQALERAEREGRVHDAQQIRFLLGEMEEAPEEEEEDLEQYLVQEGDDPFSIAEEQLGSIEFLPDFLAENKHVYAIKPGIYMNLPKVGLMADPEPPEDDASRLVDLFETKGPPGDNWTARDWALLQGFQPAQPDGTSSETAVEDAQAEDPTREKEQPFTAPLEYDAVRLDEEDYTAEELAEAQEVLDVLLELGMPDPSEWQTGKLKKGKTGPPQPPMPTPTPGNGEPEDGNWFLEFVDWLRDWLLEAFGYGEPSTTPTLPPPEIIRTTSTPTPTEELDDALPSTIQHTVESGETILGLVSEYGVSLANLEAANPVLSNRIQVDRTLLELVMIDQKGNDLLFDTDLVTIPVELANDFATSEAMIEQITGFEGLVPNPYNDPAGNCTVGYGHLIHLGPCEGTAEENELQNMTADQAIALLQEDVLEAEQAVKAIVNVKLNQNQFDALVSFTYNIGTGEFLRSEVAIQLNLGNYEVAAEELLAVVNDINGQRHPGLENRRQVEYQWFLEVPDE